MEPETREAAKGTELPNFDREAFLEEVPGCLEEIRGAAAAGDLDGVRTETQILRETVEGFCSPSTVRAAEEVDAAIERRDIVAGRAAIDRMDQELIALAGALRGLAAEATSIRVPAV